MCKHHCSLAAALTPGTAMQPGTNPVFQSDTPCHAHRPMHQVLLVHRMIPVCVKQQQCQSSTAWPQQHLLLRTQGMQLRACHTSTHAVAPASAASRSCPSYQHAAQQKVSCDRAPLTAHPMLLLLHCYRHQQPPSSPSGKAMLGHEHVL
jgi:hypothetical protein